MTQEEFDQSRQEWRERQSHHQWTGFLAWLDANARAQGWDK